MEKNFKKEDKKKIIFKNQLTNRKTLCNIINRKCNRLGKVVQNNNNMEENVIMKKFIALALALVMVLALGACTVQEQSDDKVSISLWTYPIGNWGTQADVDALIKSFNEKYPNIEVTVQYLTYTDGDDKVNTAIEGNSAPDIVMEGPERLVANWGAKGKMVDLSDLWTDAAKKDIYASVEAACKGADGKYYEYPLCMTAHCMAINKTVFEAAGAMQYIDEKTHTWTTENFIKAVDAVYKYNGGKTVGAVYCSGQGGDQGTRALINNLYGGTFTNAAHTEYTANSAENIRALELLKGMEGIKFDAGINGGEEATEFAKGNLAMAFCWNGATHNNNLEAIGTSFEVMPMAFPSEKGTDTQLCGGIWGFGIFNNGDQKKIDAAKTFIKYMCDENPVAAVKASGFWSVRQSVENVYPGDELKEVYGSFMQYMGDYYQVVGGWAAARTAWWNMLQDIGEGNDITTEVNEFVTEANAAAKG